MTKWKTEVKMTKATPAKMESHLTLAKIIKTPFKPKIPREWATNKMDLVNPKSTSRNWIMKELNLSQECDLNQQKLLIWQIICTLTPCKAPHSGFSLADNHSWLLVIAIKSCILQVISRVNYITNNLKFLDHQIANEGPNQSVKGLN